MILFNLRQISAVKEMPTSKGEIVQLRSIHPEMGEE